MNFTQSFKLAVKSLATSKMRSFLTMLGIIIGVGAVIILVSIVNGYKADMESQFESLGTNLININITPRGSTRKIDVDDMYSFADENPDKIKYISPTVTVQGQAKVKTDVLSSTSITGVNEQYADIKAYDMLSGRFMQFMDIKNRNKVCVVGSYIDKEYFESRAVGQTIKINGVGFTVIGVIDETDDSTEGSGDDMILIPYTNARTLSKMGIVTSYVAFATDKDNIDAAISGIENYLYGILADEDLYTVIAISQVLDMLNDLTSQLTIILVGIAGISLLVGGIGIMNIMLVSVTERTREIGIRKSIGAKRWDILSQFVVEAATTSAVGGIIGIIFGIGVSVAVCKAMGIGIAISVPSVVIAFSVSAAIGMIFGYMPASKAAKLNPIEALRYD